MKNEVKTEIIKKFMIENKISKTAFCKMCKISYSTFKNIMANNDNFRILALFKIAKVIKIQVYQMFNEPK